MNTVIYRSTKLLECRCDAEVILCLDVALTASGLPYINATLTTTTASGVVCGNQIYSYYIEYDENQLADPAYSLLNADIQGITCRGCLTSYIDSSIQAYAGDGFVHLRKIYTEQDLIDAQALAFGVLAVIDGSFTLTANLVVSQALTFLRGTIISTNGFTLTIDGTFGAQSHQCFDTSGGGGVVFGDSSLKESLPEWFGAVGDGVTDSTVAIQAALNSCRAVRLSPGDYLVSGGITIPNYTKLRGSGRYITKLTCNSDIATVLSASNTALVEISDIDFYFSVARTAGAAIEITDSSQFAIERCRFLAPFYGINLSECTNGFVKDLLFSTGTGGWERMMLYDACVTIYTENVVALYGNFISASPIFEIQSGCDTLLFYGCGGGASGGAGRTVNWKIDNTTGSGGGAPPRWLKFVQCIAEGGSDVDNALDGWVFTSGTSIEMIECYAATSKNGVTVASLIDGLQIMGGEYFSNAENGILINGGVAISIAQADIHNNNKKAANTWDGIAVTGGSRISISNCKFAQVSNFGSLSAQRYELNLSGACDYIVVDGNDFGTATVPIQDTTSGAHVILSNNLPTSINRRLDLPNAFSIGDVTPSVRYGTLFNTAPNVGATSITNFDDGRNGQQIEVRIDNQTTIVHDNNFIRCKGGVNIVGSSSNDIVTFRRISNIWFEVSRSF